MLGMPKTPAEESVRVTHSRKFYVNINQSRNEPSRLLHVTESAAIYCQQPGDKVVECELTWREPE